MGNNGTSSQLSRLSTLGRYRASAQLLSVLESAGHSAWYVGGCLRDALLGRQVSDIDIATSARWQDVEQACREAGLETRATGIEHGTVTVLVPDGDDVRAFEVTTFRADSPTSSDSRHPDSVTFVDDVAEDLSRRDFTINAMAWHPERGLLDPFGGRSDLESGIIRVVGDSHARFGEDALRILRACRFSSQLGFDIDQATLDEMLSHKHLVLRVSRERIVHELDLFLLGAHVHNALMRTADVLSIVLPELYAMAACEQNTKYHVYDVLEHTAWAVQYAPSSRIGRWAALCHDMGKPATKFTGPDGSDHFYGHAKVSCQLARGIAQRLAFSKSFTESRILLVGEHGNKELDSRRQIKRMLRRLDGDIDLFQTLLGVMEADILAHAPEYRSPRFDMAATSEILDSIVEEQDAFAVSMLDIDGSDLIAAGIEQGPLIGQLLDAALDAVIEGELPNEHAALLRFCMAHMKG